MIPAIKSPLTMEYCDIFQHVEQRVRPEQRNLQNVIIILLGSSVTYLTVVVTERKLVINSYTRTTFNI
jgi:glucose uptake protein GlcU